jgi:preprotein translocase subunit YajC
MRHYRYPAVDFPLVQDLVPLLILVAFALLMWMLLIRPQSRRNRELAMMQSALEVGDEVVLTSGVYGVLRGLQDDVAEVEVASGVTIRVARGAIGQLIKAEPFAQPGPRATTGDSDVTDVTEEN